MTGSEILLVLMLTGVFGGILAGIPVVLVLFGVPLLAAGIGIAAGVFDPALLGAFPQRIYGIMGNQILYSVPLFILMGKLLEHTGMAQRMLKSASGLFKNRDLSLGFAVLLVSVLVAASTGIIGATITMLGAMALPAMLRSGLPESLSAGLVCAAGSLSQIIPPSIVLILLSDQVSNAWVSSQLEIGNFAPDPISVGHLFAGAILPGLVLAGLYALYLGFRLRSPPLQANDARVTDAENERNEKSEFAIFVPVLLLLFAVPGSILAGVATPTEAASFGVACTLVLGIVLGNTGCLKRAFVESVEITGVIFGIVIAASMLSLVFRGFGGEEIVDALLAAIPGDAAGALIAVMIIIFFLGFLIEFIEITYIVVPVAAPVLFSMGIDPVWFAILVAVNLQISFLTPPLGIALFYYKSVASTATATLYRGIVPFVILQILALTLVFIFPKLATWLPTVLV